MKNFTIKSIAIVFALLLAGQAARAQCVNVYDTLRPSICAGDTFYFNGNPYTRSTRIGFGRTVADTVALPGGCDSITYLLLTVRAAAKDSFTQQICSGSVYSFNGQSLSATGIYRDTLHGASAYGCDSFRIVNLIVGGVVSNNISARICRGDSFLFNGIYLHTAGIYRDTASMSGGCDSVVILTLTYLTNPLTNINQPYCTGGGFVFNGVTLTSPGIYTDTLHGAAANGCDSVVRLTYLSPMVRVVRRDTLCPYDTLFIPGGYFILGSRGSGRYAPDTVQFNCTDTIYNFIITVDTPATPVISAAGAMLTETVSGFASYQWQMGGNNVSGTSQTYTATANGTYTVIGTDAKGCSATSAPVNVSGLSVNSLSGSNKLSIYPNPNNGVFVIETPESAASEAGIYDVLGNLVARVELSNGRNQVDLHLTDGIYFVKTTDGKGNVSSLKFTVYK